MNFISNIKDWNKFPSVDTLGYFCPLGNFIYLNEYLDDEDFKKSAENPSLDRNRFSVFIHEYQHYLDQVSTLWGIKNIYQIYNAFDSAIISDEFKFFKLRDLFLEQKRNFFIDYYTEIYNSIKGDFSNRWQFQITSGLRFDNNGKIDENKPILFMSFASADGTKISRVPLSIVSLLETTATAAEYQFQISEILKLETPHKENQIKALSAKLESKLYHPELTHYSAAVHLTSVNLNITDPILGYKISSIFAKIALNIPTELFEKIKVPSEFKSNDIWNKRSIKMLENSDRGFAFYLLIKNFLDKNGVLKSNDINIEDILSASDLPPENIIEELIATEIQKLDYDFHLEGNNFSRMIIDKTFFGSKFREQTGIGQQKDRGDSQKFIRDKLYLIFNSTYFEYEDLDLQSIIKKSISQMDLSREEWFRMYSFCESRINNFNQICGI